MSQFKRYGYIVKVKYPESRVYEIMKAMWDEGYVFLEPEDKGKLVAHYPGYRILVSGIRDSLFGLNNQCTVIYGLGQITFIRETHHLSKIKDVIDYFTPSNPELEITLNYDGALPYDEVERVISAHVSPSDIRIPTLKDNGGWHFKAPLPAIPGYGGITPTFYWNFPDQPWKSKHDVPVRVAFQIDPNSILDEKVAADIVCHYLSSIADELRESEVEIAREQEEDN